MEGSRGANVSWSSVTSQGTKVPPLASRETSRNKMDGCFAHPSPLYLQFPPTSFPQRSIIPTVRYWMVFNFCAGTVLIVH
jgi:hypothetical protein